MTTRAKHQTVYAKITATLCQWDAMRDWSDWRAYLGFCAVTERDCMSAFRKIRCYLAFEFKIEKKLLSIKIEEWNQTQMQNDGKKHSAAVFVTQERCVCHLVIGAAVMLNVWKMLKYAWIADKKETMELLDTRSPGHKDGERNQIILANHCNGRSRPVWSAGKYWVPHKPRVHEGS